MGDSNTARHLAEFWMIEPEMAFTDLQGDMDNAEAYVKHVVGYALENCAADLQLFGKFYDKQLLNKLTTLRDEPFARVRYEKAVEMLQEEIAKDPSKWDYPEVEFGTDLAHVSEVVFDVVAKFRLEVIVEHPELLKAFYMRDNDDGRTVAAMDLLVPGV